MKRDRETGLTGQTTPRPISGCPKNTTARPDRYLLRLCRNSRTKPSSQLRADWILFTNVPLATRLVNYRLLNAGYLARRPVRKPLLQRRHRQARFVWARGHLNWCDGHRQQVAFSDESRFLLYRQDGRVRVLRQAHEALLDECVLPRVQAGGSGVTKYGVFYNRGKSELHLLDGNLDQYQYIRVLETKMLPFARRDFQENAVFQDDNASSHRARRVMDFLEDENVQHMDWPAMSPDLNSIENIWLEISRGLNNLDNPPTNVAELTQAGGDIWRDIPGQKLSTLVLSIPRRLRAVYCTRGGHTNTKH